MESPAGANKNCDAPASDSSGEAGVPGLQLKTDLPSEDPKEKPVQRPISVADQLPTWLKVVLVILPVLAFLISVLSLVVSFSSLRFSMGYMRPHEDHDVVARVLGASAVTKGFSSIGTNGELFVDLALINKGNQKEIVREAFLCYSDTNDFGLRVHTWERNDVRNVQLDKGEKRVLHILTPFNVLNTGKRMWLGVAVRAIAPNASDIETIWPVCEISLAPDGNGCWTSYNKEQAPQVQIISEKLLPNQHIAPDGF